MQFQSFHEHVGMFEVPDDIAQETLGAVYRLKERNPESVGRATVTDEGMMSNVGGWIMPLPTQDCPHWDDFLLIREHICRQTAEYLKYLGCKGDFAIQVCKAEAYVNQPGAFHLMHTHIGGEFACVIWLQADKGAGDLYIMSPMHNRFINGLQFTEKENYNCMILEPRKNAGVIFSNSLIHHVDVNRSSRERIGLGCHVSIIPGDRLVEMQQLT